MRYFLKKLISSTGYSFLRLRKPAGIPKPVRDFAELAALIQLLRRHDITCVVDVGAHHGWFSRSLRRAGYKGRILAFEPIPRNADEVEKVARQDPLFSVHRYALGEHSETNTFHVLSNPGGGNTMSSFLEPTIGFLEREEISVEVRRLDDMLDELLPDHKGQRLFLKMDTQGFDMAVMRGATRWLASIKAIQSELSIIPLYHDMPSYREALTLYEEMGFGIVDMLAVGRESDGRVIEFDCRMARPIT